MLKKSLPVLLVVGLLALAFPLMVAAQGGQPPAAAPRAAQAATGNTLPGNTLPGNALPSGMAMRGAQRGGWLTGGVSLVDATAQATGLTVAEVIAALQEGQTYADIATEAGVSPQAIVDVMLEVRAETLSQAVSEGRLTQEQADAMLATMATDLLAQVNAPWEARGAGSGAALTGAQPQDGSGYRGGNTGTRGRGAAGAQGAGRSNAGDCMLLQP
ncbi:MAG: hypothetical protein BWY63_03771 [Chloroflexi bacterium ADurb.Bin360]|nr:MAG: hypothetical protein BWY63_03771 [Chloroflexi bacterium ADurb.Bin360]